MTQQQTISRERHVPAGYLTESSYAAALKAHAEEWGLKGSNWRKEKDRDILTPMQRKILGGVDSFNGAKATSREICNTFDGEVSIGTVSNIMLALEDRGLVKKWRDGYGRAYFWMRVCE